MAEQCFLDVSRNETWSEGLAYYTYSYCAVVVFALVVSLILLFRRESHQRIRFRKPWLLAISSCGFLLLLLTNPLTFASATLVPCELYSTGLLLFFPLMAWPITVRLLLWRARIRYNYQVAMSIAKFGLYDIDSQLEAFESYRFAASTKFGVILTCGVIGVYLACILIYIFTDVCFVCQEAISATTINTFYLVTVALFLLATVYVLYLYRDVPDSYGLHRESVISLSVTAAIALPSLFFKQFDVGRFQQQDPVVFSWTSVIEAGLAFFYAYSIPWQVYLSYKAPKSQGTSNDVQKLIESKTGSRYFQLYLGTEYGMENLIFYKAVLEWRESYQDTAEETREHANKLLNTFYIPGSLLELNLGPDERGAVYNNVAKTHIPIETFDKSAAVVRRYLQQSYERFKRSSFYKLYTGQLNPDAQSSITTSDVSIFLGVREHIDHATL